MKNLILARNLNLTVSTVAIKRNLTTSSNLCKYISPYDNPMPKDIEAPNVFKLADWQKVKLKGGGLDKEIKTLQRDDSYCSDPVKAKLLSESKLQSFYDGIKTKGFARETKSYQPPEDLKAKFDAICTELFDSHATEKVLEIELKDPVIKYKLIVRCIQEFDHELPNSDLYLIKTVNDVLVFYSMPVRGVNTFDSLATSSKLPKNLHVITDCVKFNPDTDTFFKGLDAFPKRAIIQDGIKSSKKYDNFKTEMYWPDI